MSKPLDLQLKAIGGVKSPFKIYEQPSKSHNKSKDTTNTYQKQKALKNLDLKSNKTLQVPQNLENLIQKHLTKTHQTRQIPSKKPSTLSNKISKTKN